MMAGGWTAERAVDGRPRGRDARHRAAPGPARPARRRDARHGRVGLRRRHRAVGGPHDAARGPAAARARQPPGRAGLRAARRAVPAGVRHGRAVADLVGDSRWASSPRLPAVRSSPTSCASEPPVCSGRPMLSVRDLHFSYGSLPVLRGVSFDARAGEVCGLFGPNGCGKTTLFRCCLGPAAGPRRDARGGRARRRRRCRLPDRARLMAYVPQEHKPPFPLLRPRRRHARAHAVPRACSGGRRRPTGEIVARDARLDSG